VVGVCVRACVLVCEGERERVSVCVRGDRHGGKEKRNVEVEIRAGAPRPPPPVLNGTDGTSLTPLPSGRSLLLLLPHPTRTHITTIMSSQFYTDQERIDAATMRIDAPVIGSGELEEGETEREREQGCAAGERSARVTRRSVCAGARGRPCRLRHWPESPCAMPSLPGQRPGADQMLLCDARVHPSLFFHLAARRRPCLSPRARPLSQQQASSSTRPSGRSSGRSRCSRRPWR